MELREWLNDATRQLTEAGVSEARLKTEWLLEHHLQIPRLELHLQPHLKICTDRLTPDLAKLIKHEPLQYVLGTTDFFGKTFKSDARALIPRPETEELVEHILSTPFAPQNVIDVGTGTGCIAISLALAKPDWSITALDISEEALELARENAAIMNANIQFMRSNLLSACSAQSADLIVSNPPYIAESDIADLDQQIQAFEPRQALVGGRLGTELIAELITQAANILRPQGRLMMEIGENQGAKVQDFLHNAGFTDILIQRDHFGRTRFASGTLTHGT